MPIKLTTDERLMAAASQLATWLNLDADAAKLLARLKLLDPDVPGKIEFRNASERADPEILLYGVIGFDPMEDGGGTTARSFAESLATMQDAKQIKLRINSPGGNAFEGLAMFNLLRDAKPRLVVQIDGVAASAAAIVAMAGDDIAIAENGSMMIHNAEGIVVGDRQEALRFAAMADKLDGQIAAAFSRRTGKRPAMIRKLMDDETYMTGPEAVAEKFADRIIPAKRGSAATNQAAPGPTAAVQRLAKIRARLVELQTHELVIPKIPLDKLN